MEKPPFQFGLKSLFAVTTAASLLLAVGMRVPTLLTGFALTAGIVFCWLMAVAAIEKAALRAIRLAGWFRNKLHTTLRNGRRANSEWQHRVLSTSAEKRQADGMNGYQFSLRTLLAAVAVVGIGVALWVAEPSWQLGAVEALVLAWVMASTALLATISTGLARAWWAGIAAESMLAVFFFFAFFMRHLSIRGSFDSETWMATFFFGEVSTNFHLLLIGWAFAPVVGLLCVLTHWLFIRSAGPAVPRD